MRAGDDRMRKTLIAVLGLKLAPTSQGCFAYHWFAFSGVHGSVAAEAGREKTPLRTSAQRARRFQRVLILMVGMGRPSLVRMLYPRQHGGAWERTQ